MIAKISVQEFVDKWSKIRLKEISIAQTHFNDVCALLGHDDPIAYGKPDDFSFEAPAKKATGKRGRADAFFRGKFIWEYKGPHADLDKAYQQLLLYRESLDNPPLLITSDTQRIIIHTNFTNTVKQAHTIDFNRILKGDGLELLKRAFFNPLSFKPKQTHEQVTKATANSFVAVADTLKKWSRADNNLYNSERTAHFIIRLLFCLFAEDMKLLPDDVFTKLVAYEERRFPQFVEGLRNLFTAMRDGGVFGFYPIPYFDGGLFDDDFIPELPSDIMAALLRACKQDWSSIDPSIFGTLFERVIDEGKRAQLGAHYTSREEIMLIVEPVLMQPLRKKWLTVKKETKKLVLKEKVTEASIELQQFADDIADVSVLDPACGSGNFLYIALRQLLDLQKEVIVFSSRYGLPEISLTVSPTQLYGIEINSYAHELAQITVWIGYLQWRSENGFAEIKEPILQPLKNIECKDAILAYDDKGEPVEPEWAEIDVVIGNPPFLGDKKMRMELGHKYVEDLRSLYAERIPGQSDLVCYWFEKSRAMINNQVLSRACLLATNSIRGGANNEVLKRIKNTGDIFMGWSDRPWTLEGANVRVSITGFDNGTETQKILDGQIVNNINSNLSSIIDLNSARQLEENANLAFIGDSKKGEFEITDSVAQAMLLDTSNTGNKSNCEVLQPWINGLDVTRRFKNMWIIDFGIDMSESEALLYRVPYEYVLQKVKPKRNKVRNKKERTSWWLHARPALDMREAISKVKRYIATSNVSKYRLFIWVTNNILPSHSLTVIAREDDYLFGVLHSVLHDLWSLHQGTSLGATPRYTPTTSFETFPFPWPPGQEPTEDENKHVATIAEAARDLVDFRQGWFYPSAEEVGEKVVKKRTLTNLYNALFLYRENVKGKHRNIAQWKTDVKNIISLDDIEELDYIHNQLDQAVLDTYGWPHNLTDEQILEKLLVLNLERAGDREDE